MNADDRKRRLELRLRVFEMTRTLFYVEDLDFHVRELFELWKGRLSDRDKAKRDSTTKFLAMVKALTKAGWLTSKDEGDFSKAYQGRTDIAHQVFSSVGTLSYTPEDFERLTRGASADLRIPAPKPFDYYPSDGARKAAYRAAELVSKYRGDTGNLAGFFTRQSIIFSEIETMIQTELDDIYDEKHAIFLEESA